MKEILTNVNFFNRTATWNQFCLDLKKLREKPVEPPKSVRKVPERKIFVVKDDDVSDESDAESEVESEEEEDDDEEYRESSPEFEVRSSLKKRRASDDEEWFLQSLSENFSGQL